ncbi:hypothetical protein N9L68_02520 [bacterium]|nr:hypothetical protein [bacterium]
MVRWSHGRPVVGAFPAVQAAVGGGGDVAPNCHWSQDDSEAA